MKGPKTIRLTVDLTYNPEVWHGDEPEAIEWFHSMLNGDDLLLGDFGEVGDMIGKVKVVHTVPTTDRLEALEAENARLRADLAKPRVKSLVWQGCESDCYITADMGNYHYEAGVVDVLERACDYVWEARYCVVGEDDLQLGVGSFEDVKAAAQAHYDAQILACLEDGTPPVDLAERVKGETND